MYQSGAIGFAVVDGVPKVGQLQVSAWSWTDTCRFRIVPGPPPLICLAPPLQPGRSVDCCNRGGASGSTSSSRSSSGSGAGKPNMPPPASTSYGEAGSVDVGSQKTQERPAPRSDEEEWKLKDVIFIEDIKNVPFGRVLKVDGAYAAVRFPSNKDYCGKEAKDVNATTGSNEDPASLLQDCRLLRKDELQVIK